MALSHAGGAAAPGVVADRGGAALVAAAGQSAAARGGAETGGAEIDAAETAEASIGAEIDAAEIVEAANDLAREVNQEMQNRSRQTGRQEVPLITLGTAPQLPTQVLRAGLLRRRLNTPLRRIQHQPILTIILRPLPCNHTQDKYRHRQQPPPSPSTAG